MATQYIEKVGRTTNNMLAEFGQFCDFVGRTFFWLITSGLRRKSLRLLLPQLFEIGVKSIPVIGITGGFIGMVMAIETYTQFKAIGQENRLGAVIFLSVVKQIGPVLASVMLAGRVGGALAAELGTMNVTEQLDALRVMGTDPIQFLVVPRFLACVLLTPMLDDLQRYHRNHRRVVYRRESPGRSRRPVLALRQHRRGNVADQRRDHQFIFLRRGHRADQLLQGIQLRRRRKRRGTRLHRIVRRQLHVHHRHEFLLRQDRPELVHRPFRNRSVFGN